MEHYYNKFIKTLRDFLKDLNRYVPNDGCTKFLECFDKLDMHKVILRYVGIMREHEAKLKDFDESVFNTPLYVFPGINLSELMNKVAAEKKKKVFIYLHTLLVISDMMVQSANDEPALEKSNTIDSNGETQTKPLEFNPYIGIGTDNSELSATDMYSAKFPEEPQQKPGIGTIANMIGIDKVLNLKQLTEQLKNMTKEDIDEATNSIKNLLGNNIDEKTSDLLSDMLCNISDELKNDTMTQGNPLDNIVKIAESVAGKMRPKIDQNNIDVTSLWNSTQSLAEKCKDENGNNLFSNGMNPFDLMNKMIANKGNGQNAAPNMDQLNEIMNSLPLPPGMNRQQQQQYMNQYMNMLNGNGKRKK